MDGGQEEGLGWERDRRPGREAGVESVGGSICAFRVLLGLAGSLWVLRAAEASKAVECEREEGSPTKTMSCEERNNSTKTAPTCRDVGASGCESATPALCMSEDP